MLHDGLEHRQVTVHEACVGAVRKTSSDTRPIKTALLADTNAPIVQVRTGSAGGHEDLLADRIVDDAVLEPSFVLAGNRDRESRKPVQEVRRAIERIDDPQRVAFASAAALLRQKSVARIMATDELDDLLLGGTVDLAHEVITALGGDRE